MGLDEQVFAEFNSIVHQIVNLLFISLLYYPVGGVCASRRGA